MGTKERKKLYSNGYSSIVIDEDRLYVLSNKLKDFSPRAVMIYPGFQVELGRDVNEFKEALKQTRLPIIIKLLLEASNKQTYQIIRMHTGKVDDSVVANIVCENNKIQAISFNRALIRDSQYRRYSQLSVYHQLSLPSDLSTGEFSNRTEQVRSVLSSVTMCNKIKVKEDGNKLLAMIDADEQQMVFSFISNKNNNGRYELSSITSKI